jgi:hypothetical protein
VVVGRAQLATDPAVGSATSGAARSPNLGRDGAQRMNFFRATTLAFLLAIVMVLMTAIAAYAAMDATLSSNHGRPGDRILLLTDDHGSSWNYDDLSSEGRQPLYLAPVAVGTDFSAACGGSGSQSVGRFEWRRNRAGVAFPIPNLPQGDYYLFMKTRGQCWRIAGTVEGARGALVLTIGNVSADNQAAAAAWTPGSLGPPAQQPAQPPSRGPAPVIIGALVAIVANR